MPSPRYTVRLPAALDALVQERIRTAGTPFAELMRDALTAYLADTPPTGRPTAPPTGADTMQPLWEQVEALTKRVEALEQTPTGRRQDADRPADTVLTPADISLTGADTTALGYDPTRFVLGRLCKEGHEFGQTGMTLRRVRQFDCPICSAAQKRAARRRQRDQRG